MLGANHVLVGPMRRHELRRAIELPARRAGLHVEPDLVDALIADVEGEPGGLPLLSTALLELWQHRDGRRLRLAAYEQTGGVRGAVARLAEGGVRAARRPPSSEHGARDPAAPRRRGGGDARRARRVALDEFERERSGASWPAHRRRLLTISEGEVEVAHEALLREWPRLRGWLEEDAEGRRLHRHLRDAARDWDGGAAATPASCTAAPGWPPRSTGRPATMPSSTRPSAPSSTPAARASERAHRRLRMVLAGVAACWSSR